MRTNRFRHQLLNWTFIQSTVFAELEDALRHFHQLWRAEKLSDVEWAATYILLFGLHHRPQDFLGGLLVEKFAIDRSTTDDSGELLNDDHSRFSSSDYRRFSTDDFLSYFANSDLKWKRHFPRGVKLVDFVCNRSLRSLPVAVNRTLAAWSRGDYPLDLREDVPSVDEVLEMQTRGRRCVSVLMKPNELRSFIEGRDALSFVVHDLLHADHFFRDPEHMHAQIEFLRRLRKCSQHPFVVRCLQSDPQFRFDWEYLIADMNTVPLHLFKTFKAFLLKAAKRASGAELNQPLSTTGEADFQKLLVDIATDFELNDEETLAWMKLNTPEFVFPEQALVLTAAVQNRNGHPSRLERAAVVNSSAV